MSSSSGRRRRQHEQMVEVINLTDDEDELIDLIADSNSMCKQAQNDLLYRQAEMRLIKTKLKKVREKSEGVRVTDHAMVRYLERVIGMDIEALRADILSKIPSDYDWKDTRVEYLNIDVGDLRYVMRDKLVITVTPIRPKEQS